LANNPLLEVGISGQVPKGGLTDMSIRKRMLAKNLVFGAAGRHCRLRFQ
jgi:hypothetical protein